jgi:hypothetical protein
MTVSALILLLAGKTGAYPQVPADQLKAEEPTLPQQQDPDAYEIYSVLLRSEMHPSWQVKTWSIKQETERGRLAMCLEPPKDQESTYRPVIEDFERRNRRRLLLQRKFDLPAYTLVNLADKALTDDLLPLFEVSAVGFDKDRARALVYLGHQCGSLCGGGTYHLMIKKNGKWETDREFRGPTCGWMS